MKSKLFPLLLVLVALMTSRVRADDISPRTLQGWLDFLGNEQGLPSVVARIGVADWERDEPRVAIRGQLYVWEDHFSIGAGKTASLRLLVVPDQDPAGAHPIVVGILDPRTGRGIFLPWARRYMDNLPDGNHMPRWMVSELAGATDRDEAQAAASPVKPLP
jgi:hypothetical protein